MIVLMLVSVWIILVDCGVVDGLVIYWIMRLLMIVINIEMMVDRFFGGVMLVLVSVVLVRLIECC